MKKFSFVEPIKIKLDKYPDVNSVYREEGDDDEGYKDFFSFENGYDVSNEDVQKWVNKSVQYLLDNPDETYSYHAGGNKLVIAVKDIEEIHVWVSNSHMEAYIPLYD